MTSNGGNKCPIFIKMCSQVLDFGGKSRNLCVMIALPHELGSTLFVVLYCNFSKAVRFGTICTINFKLNLRNHFKVSQGNSGLTWGVALLFAH